MEACPLPDCTVFHRPIVSTVLLYAFRVYLLCHGKSGWLMPVPCAAKKALGNISAAVQPGRTHNSKCGALRLWSYEHTYDSPGGGVLTSFCLSRADLVPVYSFGENEVYKQVIFEEGSWGRWVQKKFQKHIGFAPCIFHGRGLFSSTTWGLLPYSKPITTVGKVLV